MAWNYKATWWGIKQDLGDMLEGVFGAGTGTDLPNPWKQDRSRIRTCQVIKAESVRLRSKNHPLFIVSILQALQAKQPEIGHYRILFWVICTSHSLLSCRETKTGNQHEDVPRRKEVSYLGIHMETQGQLLYCTQAYRSLLKLICINSLYRWGCRVMSTTESLAHLKTLKPKPI